MLINKKNLALFAATIALTCVPVFADGLVFEPDSYPVNTAEAQTTSPYASAPAVSASSVTDVTNQVTRENNNMQEALFKLDSAQTDLRNQLLEDRAKYTEIDNKYKAIKEQRKIQKQLVQEGEKKINQIEKNKAQIRKLMNVQK